MASLPGLRREDAPAAAAADGIAGISAVLPQMQARERDQREKFSDRNRLSARRKDAVLTTECRGQRCVFLASETTGYAGGGIPQKSFSFKHRAKRVENNNQTNSYALDKNG